MNVREHVRKHKTVYISAATSVVVAGITVAIMRRKSCIRDAIGVPAQGAIGVLGGSVTIKDSTLNTVSYISAERQGPPSWVVRCLETGNVFTSQKSAAVEMGLDPRHLSEHLNGIREHVNGKHFERICMAA